MIIKNISSHLCALLSMNIKLMPGDQIDIGKFSQQERDNCSELQDAFRKGQLICIGFTHPPISTGKMRVAKARLLKTGPDQPLIPTEATEAPLRCVIENDIELKEQIQGINGDEEDSEFRYKYRDKKPQVKVVGPPKNLFVKQDIDGNVFMEPIPIKEKKKELILNRNSITITKGHAKEILSNRCIGTVGSGQRCLNSPIAGYKYCVIHMPPEILKEYKEKKQNKFFKE